MKKVLLIILFLTTGILAFSQTSQPPTPAPKPPAQKQVVGNIQGVQGGVQQKSFGPPPPPQQNMSGVTSRPNPFMQTADFALIGNPTFEGGFRAGFSYGFSKSNLTGNSAWGGNGLFSFDMTQRGINVFKSFNNKHYLTLSFVQMGTTETKAAGYTQLFNGKKWNSGVSFNYNLINDTSFRIGSPSINLFTSRRFVTKYVDIIPQIYTIWTNNYYDRDKNKWSNDFNLNTLLTNTFEVKFSRRFHLNFSYRGNMNPLDNWSVMHNILIGTNFQF